MPRRSKKARRLIVDGRVYRWTLRHSHREDALGGAVDCRQILTLTSQPSGTGVLRIVFADGPGRYVPGGAPLGSGDVGFTHGSGLNLHEPGSVRALLDAAHAGGWSGVDGKVLEVDGWSVLDAAAASRAEAAPASEG
ncbi:hypothetical protein [Streptomyces sp. NBC_01497]|uniref:hypothetical protein n=1 Tax=Streptomyces sp. NBC_01497 TaxID=2903885 RepID=UPI002E35C425|nr:hypothetical protein [Streptomyces sp. NBC_01497]